MISSAESAPQMQRNHRTMRRKRWTATFSSERASERFQRRFRVSLPSETIRHSLKSHKDRYSDTFPTLLTQSRVTRRVKRTKSDTKAMKGSLLQEHRRLRVSPQSPL